MFGKVQIFAGLLALINFATIPVLAADESRFSLAVGSNDHLLILGANGEHFADLPGPTLEKVVKVGNATFEVSYGRDANGQLTATLASPSSGDVKLHFSAGGKSIDADKAVVTLTFSPDLKGVMVDPGYTGTVEVDSHVLQAHSLKDEQPKPEAVISAAQRIAAGSVLTPATATTASRPEPPPAPAPNSALAGAYESAPPLAAAPPAPASPASATNAAPLRPADVVTPSAPPMLAGQLTPLLAPPTNAASNAPPTPSHQPIRDRFGAPINGTEARDVVKPMKLYWSEPVTFPRGWPRRSRWTKSSSSSFTVRSSLAWRMVNSNPGPRAWSCLRVRRFARRRTRPWLSSWAASTPRA